MLFMVLALGLALATSTRAPVAAQAAEGFGAATPGGAGGAVVRVTTLADSGPGSLRSALAGGNRTVVFDVAGDIVLADDVHVRGPFVTIDGTTAPAPGITLRNHGLFLLGTEGAHDVVVRGLRVRNAAGDGIHVARGAYNVLIERVSIHGSGDGNLDITEVRDVTVAWSILAEPAGTQKNMLIKYAPSRITLHHNLFVAAQQRNPQVRIDDAGTPASTTTLDMRNNVVWDWRGGYGTQVWYGPRANVVRNFYSSPLSSSSEQAKAIVVSNGAHAYVEGNVSGDDININGAGTETGAFPAPFVTTQTACDAAAAVLGGAGLRPLDAVDRGYVSAVSLAACPSATPPAPLPDLVVAGLAAPASASPGASLSLSVTTRNAGTANAGPSTTRIYLSIDGAVDGGDLALGAVAVPGLAAGAAGTSALGVTLPGTTAAGTWRLIARSDAGGVVTEAIEGNNTLAVSLTVGTPTGGGTPTARDLIVAALRGPRGARPGESITVSLTVSNTGTSAVPASSAAIDLVPDGGGTPAAVRLGAGPVPALGAGASVKVSVTGTVPPGTTSGDYDLVGIADAAGAIAEIREDNNTRTKGFTVR
jgi:pectate lyase